ncbi:hypothetical protein PMI29_05276 [Pseudomonas sp. GM49]|uniref:hypothetical protein n=1 Tax=Pseudomonas sp. GM49 TaxID=1144331 RepID=UPI0002704104|nr:hypothetical protein [Pseudomonas sp. GM49]EJM55788.1 hypothetical protein PMI29_05276 [Pseudomonas sp. GM49]
MDTWLNARPPDVQPAPEKTTGVTEPWRVRKPGVDGIITRYEGFDARPPLIGQGIVPMRIKTLLVCAMAFYPDATAQAAGINP